MRKRVGKEAADSRRRGKIKAGSSVDAAASFTRSLRDAAVKQFGQDSSPELKDYLNVEGLSLRDNFALQYVMGVDVLALNRLISIMGGPGGGKTQFCLWLSRLFLKFPGLFLYFDAEKKPSPSQFTSVLQLPMERLEAQFIPCKMDSMQDMVNKLLWYGEFYKKTIPDLSMPMFILIDSISALDDAKAQVKAKKGDDKENNMQAAQNAKRLTQAIRTYVAEYLSKLPIVVAMITHQKTKIATGWTPHGGTNLDNGTGGVHKDFQASWRFVIETTKRHNPGLADDDPGQVVEHTLFGDKCGMGEDHRMITYATHTYTDPETDQVRTDLDFDSALIRLLFDDKKTGKIFLKSKLGLVKTAAEGGSGALYNIGALNLKKLTMQQAGNAINNSPDLIRELQRYFRISSYTVFGEKPHHRPEVAEVAPEPEPEEADAPPEEEGDDGLE